VRFEQGEKEQGEIDGEEGRRGGGSEGGRKEVREGVLLLFRKSFSKAFTGIRAESQSVWKCDVVWIT
jgi:hypothetical protein